MNYNIEIIRLIAVILITFTHTRHNFEEGFIYFILEELPKYGTLILSIISGYLFWTVSRNKKNLLESKIKSLLIPFLISNGLVLIAVTFLYYGFSINLLNRLSFDYSLITEGLLSLNSPPVNPPTYFIRDIFVIFLIAELLINRKLTPLIILVPLVFFGKLLLRPDIIFLFAGGVLYANFNSVLDKRFLIGVNIIAVAFCFYLFEEFLYYAIACLIFVSFINLKLKFYKTGGFTYILHLYHSPIMIVTYSLFSKYIELDFLNVLIQIFLSLAICYLIYLATLKISFLRIISGGR